MILTCPSCSARFVVNDDALRPSGRNVKCGRCAHVWSAPPPPAEEPIALDEPVAEPPVVERRERRPPRANLPALPQKRRGRGGRVVLILIVLLALAAAGLWFGREPLVGAWPAAAKIYAAVGLAAEDAPLPGAGLRIEQPRARQEEENGTPYLVIDGEVVNEVDETRPVPEMVLVLLDGQQNVVQEWPFTTDVVELRAGERVAFSTRLANPSKEATDLRIEFTNSVDTR